jgi:hypothetical protein
MKERGLYLPDGTFRSEYSIRTGNSPGFVMTADRLQEERSFNEWMEHMEYIRKMRRMVEPLTRNIEVRFNQEIPQMIALIGDTHIGGETDYVSLREDVSAIKQTDGATAIILGDLVDGLFFSSGSTQDRQESLNEEAWAAKAMLDELNGKLIAAWGGDHDLWAEQSGLSMYHEFQKRYHAHLMHGIGYIDFYFGNQDKPAVRSAGAHRHLGYSIYSVTAAAERLQRESAQECNLVYCGHNHRKGISEKTLMGASGTRRMLFIAVGPYKMTDRYARKKGYAQQEGDALGGIGIVLHPDGRQEAYWSIQEGCEKLTNLSEV